jgi:hypothetical protein
MRKLAPFTRRALDDAQPVTVPEDGSEEAAQEWADGVAQTIGAIWLSRYPGGKDW